MIRLNPIDTMKDVAHGAHDILENPVGATRKAAGRAGHAAGDAVGRGRSVAGKVATSARDHAIGAAAAATALLPSRKPEHPPARPAEPEGPVAEPAVPRKSQGDPLPPTRKQTASRTTKKSAPRKASKKPLSAAQVAAEERGEVTTPVGTTGADVATNPDTTETDLQQPGTEPLMDPSTTKAVASEMKTMRKAADPDKG